MHSLHLGVLNEVMVIWALLHIAHCMSVFIKHIKQDMIQKTVLIRVLFSCAFIFYKYKSNQCLTMFN